VSSGDIELELADGMEEKEVTERGIMNRQSPSISASSQNSTGIEGRTTESPATSRDISIPSSEEDEKSEVREEERQSKEERSLGKNPVTPSTSKGLTQSAPELSEKKENRRRKREAKKSGYW
jgi:hypothetical protein